jgi:hypothetical protein
MRLIPALPALLLLAALDAQHLARADNWGHPMTFELMVGRFSLTATLFRIHRNSLSDFWRKTESP